MAVPVIGITTYACDEKGRYTLPAEYVSAVQRAGGLPVLVPPGAKDSRQYLEVVDGLILAGGGDIAPEHYGGVRHSTLYQVDANRDALELALAKHALEQRIPMLAICRGLQIVNIALGGTLVEHLPDEVGDTVAHRAPPREPVPHAVSVRPDSQLAAILGATGLQPMSWHHQGIRKLAEGLEAVAHAPDGTIEGAELPSHPWLIGVQWHPELTAAHDVTQQRLFDALVGAASAATDNRD